MSTPKTVQFKIVDNRLIADPPVVIVTESQTLIEFKLLIGGLSFASTGAIQVPPQYADSFMGPWTQNPPDTASLMNSYNVFGDVPYTVMVVNASGRIYPLVFQTAPVIRNSMP